MSVEDDGLDTGLMLGLGSGIGLDLTVDFGRFVSVIDLLAGLDVQFGSETAAFEV